MKTILEVNGVDLLEANFLSISRSCLKTQEISLSSARAILAASVKEKAVIAVISPKRSR